MGAILWRFKSSPEHRVRHPVASVSQRQSEIAGTGRRVRLRGVWEQSCGGSSPLLSTLFITHLAGRCVIRPNTSTNHRVFYKTTSMME